MKIQEGVYLHFIESKQFTTNTIKVRFTAPLQSSSIADRVLVANMLEQANQDFPNPLQLRRQLAKLYGSQLQTQVSKMGNNHLVDLNLTYVQSDFLPDKCDVTEELLELLRASLFRPLKKRKEFDSHLFEIEKKNLLSFLLSEEEDSFYLADRGIRDLFYTEEEIKLPSYATPDLVAVTSSQSTYQAYRNMLRSDRIDFFFTGQFDRQRMIDFVEAMDFGYRNPKLSPTFRQERSVIIKERVERKEVNQSILELAYPLQVVYRDDQYPVLLVFNGLFGGMSHSKLFMDIREKKGLAYSIDSSLSIFTGLLKVTAGIDRSNRLPVMKAVHQSLLAIKKGKIGEEELSMTKKLLIAAAKLGRDSQDHEMELLYRKELFQLESVDLKDWIASIEAVTIEDIVNLAQPIRLQAIYFLEGVDS
ncbi:insulinase family protein [Streptococcus suis]|uniref:Insulinase family protein n=1 Tax=Streptococcus suis TaxID=1307 RepID=A0A4T2GKU6_STRSU|nr:insulinase family protein [Streptococcus suis]MBM7270007.1 insulinase family protein [Streptococcus suis]TIH99261.1 insulinase family protein [Streptococcus suis]